MKDRKAELSPEEAAAEALVLDRLINLTRFLRASKKQPAEVAQAAAKFEGQFARELAKLKPAA